MAEKTFLEVFKRYEPKGEKLELLKRVLSSKVRFKKNPLCVEVELSFAEAEDPELIYEIEDDCRLLYEAETFKILPHFPPESFRIEKFGEIAAEAAVCGAVTNGFFSGAEYSDDGEIITAHLPYFDAGLDFVRSAGTEAILSNILFSRYGIKRKVVIKEGEGAEERYRTILTRREETLVNIERENRERIAAEMRANREAREAEARENDPHFGFEKRSGISTETGKNENLSETLFKRGTTVYDVSEPTQIFGESFVIEEPHPLSDVENARNVSVFLGTVFEVTAKETRAGDKMNVSIGISDGASGIYIKKAFPITEVGFIVVIHRSRVNVTKPHKSVG